MHEHDLQFRAMGCAVRVLAGPPSEGSIDPSGEESTARVRQFIDSFDAKLTRFNPSSELCHLNASPLDDVDVSPLLESLVSAAIWAANESGGLIDPTLVGELESVGYAHTLSGVTPASLADALAAAPRRRPAQPRGSAAPANSSGSQTSTGPDGSEDLHALSHLTSTPAWRQIKVSPGRVSRPPRVRVDSGGVGKGLAADAAAQLLADRSRFCVSAGGDMRIGGPDAAANPYPVPIDNPFGGEPLTTLKVGSGAVATSGIGSRIWQNTDGSFAHHLLDPSTGKPAWTGLIQVTAAAPTALEAETIAKRVLLGGPKAVGLLEHHGGVTLTDDRTVELFGEFAKASLSPKLLTLDVSR